MSVSASSASPGAGATFWRLIGYVRPYLGVLLVALICAGFYEGARYGRAYLLKPLTDDVILPQQASGAAIGGWLGEALGGGAEPDAAAAGGQADEAVADEQALRARLGERVDRSLLMVVVAALGIVLVMPLAHFALLYLTQYTMGRVLVDVQQELCAKLLRLPLRFHQESARGDTMSRTTNDATRAHFALDLLFGDVLVSGVALLMGAGMMLAISWKLTLAAALIGPVVGGVIGVFGRRIRKASKRRQESLGNVTGRLLEILAGIKIIKAFRAQDAEADSFQQANLRYFRRNMKVVKNRALARTFVEGLNGAIGVGILIVGVVLVGNGLWGLSLGSLLAFSFVIQTTYRPVKDLTKGWTHLMDCLPAAERFFELLDRTPEPADPPDALRIDGLHEGIRFDGVSFSYGRGRVLEDLNLEVGAGEMVAIVGATGAGKTTLADLLLRFYDPEMGSIEVDGIDLRRIARSSWLDQVAVVTQEPFLFAGSIRDNIRYGRPDASDAEIEAAAVAAHVKEFVDAIPDGYDTSVGEAGVRLSGGQRQRVTIARAILRNPAVLVFDEATSALDAKSERIVQEAIDALLGGRTVFVIAHRLSTIRNADKIVVLEGGRIAEVGSHDALMATSGRYRELVATQTSAG